MKHDLEYITDRAEEALGLLHDGRVTAIILSTGHTYLLDSDEADLLETAVEINSGGRVVVHDIYGQRITVLLEHVVATQSMTPQAQTVNDVVTRILATQVAPPSEAWQWAEAFLNPETGKVIGPALLDD